MKKKTLALILALVMVFGAAVGGTIAYLTAKTNPVVNTFTVGDIGNLTLNETQRTYNIVPGVNLDKDPKVAYDADENDVPVYVFVKVTAPDWTVTDNTKYTKSTAMADPALSFNIDNRWNYLKTEGNNYIYYKDLAANTNLTATSVIAGDKVNVSGSILDGTDIESLNNTTLTFTAYACQQASFADALAAWNTNFGA